MGEIPAEMYEAAARAIDRWYAEWTGGEPNPNHVAAIAVVDAVYPLIHAAGVAAGRAQAAADIRAADVERIEQLHGDTVRLGLTVAARIAEGGDPR